MASIDTPAALNKMTEEIKKMAKAQGAGIPEPKAEDSGKVLMVDAEGKWTLASIPSQLPAVESTDEGKILAVNAEGEWAAADAPTELPTVSGDTDEGKVLTVQSDGSWAAEALPD